ncbi:hypothetical protein [Kitasatospora sp. A2-31]|uniref:hypothetical protein n=1 Tax=Kitasatospora sp. A2-31 TaxID=2916414 RepID=UPI001EE922D0|nr:hypothetical protein [Kitasatospora sp. A2-31]MCG6493416.1 hypothetical protein [Kitasatospora sp. A2-31]
MLAPIDPAAIRAARRALDPAAPYEQDPAVATDLATIQRITAWLPTWQHHGAADLEWRLRQIDAAEDRLLTAHGHAVPTSEQRHQARRAAHAANAAIQAAADLAHPAADCPRCRAWEDCPDADRAYRDALHTAWVDRWTVAT